MRTAVESIVSFVAATTDVSDAEVRPYIDEIVSNREFHDSIKAKQRTPSGERLPRASVNSEVGSILYAVCRQVKPESVVETGVAAGLSSSHFLCALDKNRYGQLFSIDFPTWEPDTGWIVPDDLKTRWTLISGRSSEKLPGLLERLGKIQVFFHDGEHTYENMLWEYESAWFHLTPRGILLSHNIDFTDAFRHFSQRVNAESWSFQNLGGIMKK